MAFRPPRQQPQFADLKGILAQTKKTENPLYQTIQVLIDRLTQFQSVTLELINSKLDEDSAENAFSTKFATYLTQGDEIDSLPNSFQLLAGTGITFDMSVANKLTINGSSGGYAPMSTGAEPLEIMSDGAGSVLMVGFSE